MLSVDAYNRLLEELEDLQDAMDALEPVKPLASGSALTPTYPSGRSVYRLLLGPRAQKDLDQLVGDTWQRVREGLLMLARTPRPKGCVKLSTWAWRVRVGEIRVLHDVDDKARTVEVLMGKRRRDVYRGV